MSKKPKKTVGKKDKKDPEPEEEVVEEPFGGISLNDLNGAIEKAKASGKWGLVLDRSNLAGKFMRY